MEVISINIEWSGPSMTSQAIDAKLSVRGRLKKAKISKWEAEGGNSFHLDEIGEFEKELFKALEAATVKQTLSEREMLGYCYLEEPQPVNSHVWCLEVYSVSILPEHRSRNHTHKVLVLLPVDDEPGVFRRVGVGDVWLESFR
jgi:hypothetical protein